jgi:hypothetical protein
MDVVAAQTFARGILPLNVRGGRRFRAGQNGYEAPFAFTYNP